MFSSESNRFLCSPCLCRAHAHTLQDTTELEAKANVDAGLLQAITDGDEGFMRAGAMPAVTTASSAGAKSLLDSLGEKATSKKDTLSFVAFD